MAKSHCGRVTADPALYPFQPRQLNLTMPLLRDPLAHQKLDRVTLIRGRDEFLSPGARPKYPTPTPAERLFRFEQRLRSRFTSCVMTGRGWKLRLWSMNQPSTNRSLRAHKLLAPTLLRQSDL